MRVILDPVAIRELLTSKDGPVGVDLQRRVLRVTNAAKKKCNVNTGRLRSSIRGSISSDAKGLVGTVGTDLDYALYVHNGTKAHRIEAKGDHPLHWSGAGGDAFAWYVDHPGYKGNPFLTDALKEAAG